jgi:hypothetical protein
LDTSTLYLASASWFAHRWRIEQNPGIAPRGPRLGVSSWADL